MCRAINPGAQQWWVGKWSQLETVDVELLGEFAGRSAFDLCVMNLVKVLRFDPYVIVPLDIASPTVPVGPKTASGVVAP